MKQSHSPILQKLTAFKNQEPISFHVPGHKSGRLFPEYARPYFDSILPMDLTELPGLDDLHAPHGMIREAEEMAADFFQVDHTFFLVGGTTVGNLAMLLATCAPGDEIIVQRNCHKSIMNGLELAGARPVFIAPTYDEASGLYAAPSCATLEKALTTYPLVKGVVLTYPDYFGKTFPIKDMIDMAHAYNKPVLVDEAHGAHFALKDERFPDSSTSLGADAVVHSAHKMAPAMTMASYLHMRSNFLLKEDVAHYLQMLQSSSPSYPLLASLDIARTYLQTLEPFDIDAILTSAEQLRELFSKLLCLDILSPSPEDDPLKITLKMRQGYSGKEVANLFEEEGVYPELATDKHILFIHGLAPFTSFNKLENAIKNVQEKLKRMPYHDIIHTGNIFRQTIGELALTYPEMKSKRIKHVTYLQAEGSIAAEAIIPYPPGVPILLRGERISEWHLQQIYRLQEQGVTIQTRNQTNQLSVFDEGVEDF